MDDGTGADRGWRGSRDGWLDAAQAALIEGGVDAVKIQPLAQRLRLSRTSFYWFFKDRAALLDALRARWRDATTAPLVAAAGAYAETATEAVLNVIACFLSPRDFDAGFEFAVRSWALQDAETRAALHRADTERLAALDAMLRRWGCSEAEADVRARTVYLAQVGYIAMQTEEPLEVRLARIPHYAAIFSGRAPTESELARFEAQVRARQPEAVGSDAA
ncbi:MAG: TetR/AcrR family transcriptional regulator [Rhodobacteraceae bacterium]|nr:MAG: TetR/AcrR family transcriptional regulator [Paracoccaceae bacterium]